MARGSIRFVLWTLSTTHQCPETLPALRVPDPDRLVSRTSRHECSWRFGSSGSLQQASSVTISLIARCDPLVTPPVLELTHTPLPEQRRHTRRRAHAPAARLWSRQKRNPIRGTSTSVSPGLRERFSSRARNQENGFVESSHSLDRLNSSRAIVRRRTVRPPSPTRRGLTVSVRNTFATSAYSNLIAKTCESLTRSPPPTLGSSCPDLPKQGYRRLV
jgi:hypothetical protein